MMLLLASSAGVAAPPVEVLLYGPSPGMERLLDELPREMAYRRITYRAHGAAAPRNLLVGISGGVEPSDIVPLLDAARLFDWSPDSYGPWRLFIHGDGSRARVTVRNDTCHSPTHWLLLHDSAGWTLLDGPGAPTHLPRMNCGIEIEPAIEHAVETSS
jgi:hypothetical protein